MTTAFPPDLRVLYRKLTSIPPEQLPHALPSLINHVIRCKQPLSTSPDPKAKGQAAEVASLVAKLKKSITTLVNSRAREARFAAIALIKTAVDVGGWEVLRGSKEWVQGLLAIVKKGDPYVSKELAIVALTRIYALLQPFQTLVREIATPTIPEFTKACLELIKSPSTPQSVVETVCDAFTTLLPLYPTIFRPSSNQVHNAIKPFLAPTESDSIEVPESLKQASRRLVVSQHFVAPKSGGSDDWTKVIDGIFTDLHATADQVFRAIDESWEPSSGIVRTQVSLDQAPSGAGQLPAWSGIQAGSQRLTGLFDFLSTCLCQSTKSAVALPLTKFNDAISRVCLIARLSPKTQTWDQALQTRAAVGREEKDELWSVIPDIHIAALHLLQTMYQRLGDDMLPYIADSLENLLRVFNSGISITDVRSASYSTLNDILTVGGPTLSKSAVDMLQPAVGATCRDLQEDAGYLKPAKKASGSGGETKKNGIAANADLFLQKTDTSAEIKPIPLEHGHKLAASTLLASLFTNLPQQFIKPSHRSLLDQTAILTRNKDAMLASVLNPYTDPRGRRYASILPHLTQQYPQDQSLEILRTNLRTDIPKSNEDLEDISEEEDDEEDEDEEMAEAEEEEEEEKERADTPVEGLKPATLPTAPQMDLPVQSNPFESKEPETKSGFGDVKPRASSPPKRKHEGSAPTPQKRQELEHPARQEAPTVPESKPVADTAAEADDDSDDDESVHLNMEMEDDDDEDE